MKVKVGGHGWCDVWVLPKLAPTRERRWRYVRESYEHGGKMKVALAREIIKNYTKPGELVLDPMAGVGTTLIECALLGRNAIGVELEKKWAEVTERNIEAMEKLPTLIRRGKAWIIWGDSENLSALLSTHAGVIVFSPPYETEQFASKNRDRSDYFWRVGGRPARYIRDKTYPTASNIANLKYVPIDAITFSPPYSNSKLPGLSKEHAEKLELHFGKGFGPSILSKRYSDNPSNIGNLPHGTFDDITKPKRETYLSAMFRVYKECFNALKPGGVMVLVVKPFIRHKKVMRLDLDTKRLCEIVGFRWIGTKLFLLPTKSFLRNIYDNRCRFAKSVKDKKTGVVRKECGRSGEKCWYSVSKLCPNFECFNSRVENIDLLSYEFVLVFEKPASPTGGREGD